MLSLSVGPAQEKNWDGNGSGSATSWTASTGNNWNPNGIPTASNWINFRSSDTAPGTGMEINFGTTNPFVVQTINYGLTANNSVGGGGTATAGNLQLNGPSGMNTFIDLISVAGAGNFAVQTTQSSSGALTLQLNASGTFSTASTGGLVISSAITETGGARSVTIAGQGGTVNGQVSSSSYGTRAGTYNGAVVFTGSNSYTGTTTVGSGGYLNVGNTAAVSNSSAVSVSSGGQIQLGVAVGGSYALGAGTLTLNGSGPSAAAHAGALSIGRNVNGGTTHTVTNTISLASVVTLNARDAANTLALSGQLTGSGGIVKQGSGTLTVSNASNDYTGATAIDEGTLQLATGDNRLPTNTVVSIGQGGISTRVGTLDLNDQDQTITGLNSVTGSNTDSGFNNTVTTSTGAATLTVNGSANSSFGDGTNANSGIITGAVSLVKSGTGTLTLGDTNTYTGTTSVTGGKLAVNGSLGASSAVSVTGTGSLGGTGTVNGATTVGSTGTLAPGNSIGTLTFAGGASALSLTAGSTIDFEYNASSSAPVAGSDNDRLLGSAGDTLTFTGLVPNTSQVTIDVSIFSGAHGSASPLTYTIAEFGTISGLGSGGDVTNLFNVIGEFYGTAVVMYNNGGTDTLTVSFTPAPEPAAVLAVAAAGLGLARVVRRRRAGPSV